MPCQNYQRLEHLEKFLRAYTSMFAPATEPASNLADWALRAAMMRRRHEASCETCKRAEPKPSPMVQ